MRPALPLLLIAALAAPAAAAEDRAAWGRQLAPAAGPARAIGGYALGCLGGAAVLPGESADYQILRPQRNRYWGHPDLIRFVQDLAARLRGQGIGPILVGDLAQPRGGPMSFGHGSHQTGLDVDIWLRLPQRPLAAGELAEPVPQTMVDPDMTMAAAWGEPQARLIAAAAQSPEADRIFVNAAIKRALCQAAPPGGRDWLRKLRPWWGHDEHIHVRLRCPPDSPACTPQPALPPGDGCGDLDWWFSAAARAPRPKPAVVPPPPPLPPQCAALIR